MEKKFYGYTACIGVFLYAFVNMGSGLSFSLFLSDLAERCNVSVGTTMYFYSVGMTVSIIATLILPMVVQKTSLRVACVIGTLTETLAFIIIAYTRSIIVVYVAAMSYGISVAFGLAAPASIVVGQWFIKKRTQMLGIGTAFMSLGGIVILSLVSYVTQTMGTTAALLVVGGIDLVVGLFCEIFLIKTPEQLGQKPLGWEDVTVQQGEESCKTGLTMKQALKTPALWTLLIANVIFYLAYEGVASYGPTYYQECGLSFATASILAVALQVLVLVGGFLGGWVGERLGLKIQITMFCCFLAVGLLSLFVWKSNPAAVFLWTGVGIGGLGEASFGFIAPGMCGPLFGDRDYDAIVSAITAAGYAGSVISAFGMNLAISLGGMSLFYLAVGIMTFITMAALLMALAKPPVKRKMS